MVTKGLALALASLLSITVFADQGTRPPLTPEQQPDVQSATRWDIHDDDHYEALVAVQDPKLVHAAERIKANKFSIYGVEIGSVAKLVENGRKLAEYRATITVNAMKKAQDAFATR